MSGLTKKCESVAVVLGTVGSGGSTVALAESTISPISSLLKTTAQCREVVVRGTKVSVRVVGTLGSRYSWPACGLKATVLSVEPAVDTRKIHP